MENVKDRVDRGINKSETQIKTKGPVLKLDDVIREYVKGHLFEKLIEDSTNMGLEYEKFNIYIDNVIDKILENRERRIGDRLFLQFYARGYILGIADFHELATLATSKQDIKLKSYYII